MEPPFGFCWGPYGREVDHAEQAVIARARALRWQGLSLRGIAKKLTDEQHTNRNGGPILATQVFRMLQRDAASRA